MRLEAVPSFPLDDTPEIQHRNLALPVIKAFQAKQPILKQAYIMAARMVAMRFYPFRATFVENLVFCFCSALFNRHAELQNGKRQTYPH